MEFVTHQRERLHYSIVYIVYKKNQMPSVQLLKFCDTYHISIVNCDTKSEVTCFFQELYGKTLIVSAGNRYLFPHEIITKENVTIINFHNALLPKYPGRNAPTWAIYNGESRSGATWHIVNEVLDGGCILWQKSCDITADMKAYELTREIIRIAGEGFERIFEDIWEKGVVESDKLAQYDLSSRKSKNRKIYYACEIPNGGFFSLSDAPEDIYRLLRCTDYGLMAIFPPMRTNLPNGSEVEIRKYKKIVHSHADTMPDKVQVDELARSIVLAMDKSYDLLMIYKVH